MKKQPVIQSKANELQQRLINRETYQLVNAKQFGTARSRNERQLEKKIHRLHKEQAKTLAKIRDEIYEVKVHHKMLKEVDDSARDPRTAAEKTAEIMQDNNSIKNSNNNNRWSGSDFDYRTLDLNKLDLRKNAKQKGQLSSMLRNGQVVDLIGNQSPRLSPRMNRASSNPSSPQLPLRSNAGPVRATGNTTKPSPETAVTGHKPTFLCGILDMKVKRDAGLVQRYNYNLRGNGGDKLPSERSQQVMPEIAPKTKPSQISGNNRVNCPTQISLNSSWDGRRNRRTTGGGGIRPRTESFPKAAPRTDDATGLPRQRFFAPAINNSNSMKETPGITIQVYDVQATGTDSSSSSDDVTSPDEESSPTEDWGELGKCRYLRRPRGYETPEASIEEIFR